MSNNNSSNKENQTVINEEKVLRNDDDDVEEPRLCNTDTVSEAVIVEGEHSVNNSNDPVRNTHGRSLNAVYGSRMGFWQSLSLILNAGLMIYAHVGLSAVFLSNHERIDEATASNRANTSSTSVAPVRMNDTEPEPFLLTGACTVDDLAIWERGGALNKTSDSTFCARKYGGSGCLLNIDCNTECFVETIGYTNACAGCFAEIPVCSLQQGCAFICAAGESPECTQCTIPCNLQFYDCSGLPTIDELNQTTSAPSTPAPTPISSNNGADAVVVDVCERQQEGVDWELVEKYYVVYELTFFNGVKKAWESGSYGLAVLVIIFSGIWPYTKNIILMLAWYLPLAATKRTSILTWLRRLGKYTLIDVYLVLVLLVGVTIEILISGIPIIIKGEPRPAIIAFLFATLWEFFHIEWMTYYNQKEIDYANAEQSPESERVTLDAMRFQSSWNSEVAPYSAQDHRRWEPLVCKSAVCLRASMWSLLGTVIALFLTGSFMECIRFTSVLAGETEGCARSYNLYTMGAVLISDIFLYLNRAKPATWIYFIAYISCIIALPLFVHLVQALVIGFNVKGKKLCLLSDICWTFASVDVLLIAIVAAQWRFDDMIGAFAGNTGSKFFGIHAQVGPGFFILIAYSVLAGILQHFFNSAISEFYHIDPYHKVSFMWTKMFGCLLEKRENAELSKRQSSAPLEA